MSLASCGSFLGREESKGGNSSKDVESIGYNSNQEFGESIETERQVYSNENRDCSVAFFNGETQLTSFKAKVGDQPVYKGPIPADKIDEIGKNKITYNFVGWSQDPDALPEDAIKTSNLPVVADDTVYFAIFSAGEESNTDKVTVSFYNDTKYVSSESVIKGQAPKYKAAIPAKATEELPKGYKRIYTFAGWHTNRKVAPRYAIKTVDLPVVYESTSYYAIFTYTDVKIDYNTFFYSVTFMNFTTQLSKETYLENTKPTYYGSIPTTKSIVCETTKKQFTFVGWSTDKNAKETDAIPAEKLPVVTSDTTYYAIYSCVESPLYKYKVTFKNDEETLFEDNDVFEGHIPSYKGETPTKIEEQAKWKFVGWHTNPEASASQAIEESKLPVVTEDTVYYAIFTSNFFSLNKSEVELDMGGERKYTHVGRRYDPVEGELSPVFSNTAKITCNYSTVNNYSLNDLTVQWSLEEKKDSSFFNIETVEEKEAGVSEIVVKAIKQSRITKLKAALVSKDNPKTVLKVAYCELRSVTIDYAHVGDYSYEKETIAGEVGSNLGPGYAISALTKYSSVYAAEVEDLVYPTKINAGGNIKPVRAIHWVTGFRAARNLYIPDTVFSVFWRSIDDTVITNSVIFAAKANSLLLIEKSNFPCTGSRRDLGSQILNKTAKLVFPYNKYALNINEKDEVHEEFKYPTWTKYQMEKYNGTTTLFKKI